MTDQTKQVALPAYLPRRLQAFRIVRADRTTYVLRDKLAVRQALGYLPQEFGVYPRISAQDMLEHLALLKGIVRRKERRDMVQ